MLLLIASAGFWDAWTKLGHLDHLVDAFDSAAAHAAPMIPGRNLAQACATAFCLPAAIAMQSPFVRLSAAPHLIRLASS
jgi:hypothetical protein